MDNMYCKGPGEKMLAEDTFLPEEEQLYIPWPLGENDMQSLFVEMHKNDYMEALDIAICNLEAERGQPFMNEWQVQETVRDKEREFECWSSKQFVSICTEENGVKTS